MSPETLKSRNFEKELVFSFSRSSGPGGQHVNKTETRVELRFHIPSSQVLGEQEKELITERLASKLTREGELIIFSQQTRSQTTNKDLVLERFFKILSDALQPVKARKKTSITPTAREKRLRDKKQLSEKKTRRKDPDPDRE